MEFEMDTAETKNLIRPEGRGVELILTRFKYAVGPGCGEAISKGNYGILEA